MKNPFFTVFYQSICMAAVVLAQIVPAYADDTTTGYLQSPSAVGNEIAFEYAGRIWLHDGTDQPATRLTSVETLELSPALSPDGTKLAYVKEIGAELDVFLLDRSTGITQRLTFDGSFDTKLRGWLDDDTILYSTSMKSAKRGPLMFSINVTSGAIHALPLSESAAGCVLDDQFIFVRNEELLDSNRMYQGGYAQQIHRISARLALHHEPTDPDANQAPTRALTASYPGASRNPICIADRIYFLTDRSGRFNIWSMDRNGEDLQQHSFETELDIRHIAPWHDQQLVYEQLGQLYGFDLGTNTSRPLAIPLPDNAVPQIVDTTADLVDASEFHVSADGKTIIAVIRGKIWQIDTPSMDAICIYCASGTRAKAIAMGHTPDTLYALLDLSGEYEIYRFNLATAAEPIRVTTIAEEVLDDLSLAADGTKLIASALDGSLYDVNLATGQSHALEFQSRTSPVEISWSGNGRYATFVTYTPEDLGQISLYDAVCGNVINLTNGRYDVSSPVFSAQTDEIFFLADINFRSGINDTWAPLNYWPAYDDRSLIYAFDLAGLARTNQPDPTCAAPLNPDPNGRDMQLRTIELPYVAGDYDTLFTSNGFLHALEKRDPRDDWGTIVKFDDISAGGRSAGQDVFGDRIYRFAVAASGGAMVAVGPQGPATATQNLAGNWAPTSVLKPNAEMVTSVDLVAERRQMFAETWRMYRDHFWDADMNGIDWAAMRMKYEPALPRVPDRDSFNRLVSHMVSELGAGHTSLALPARTETIEPGVGKLGATLESDLHGLRITAVFDGDLQITEERAPLSMAFPQVNPEDVLLRVDGKAVRTQGELDDALNGRVGQNVILTLQRAGTGTFRTTVPVISASHEAWLRQKAWAQNNLNMVENISDGHVGYIHLQSSYEQDFSELVRKYPQFHLRNALILDLRGNNGGNVDPWVLSFLQRRTWLYVQDRYDDRALKHPRESFDGQVIALIDGDTYSDGELIAEGIRRLGLGQLVGTRTSGAGKWVNDDKTLIDGGRVRVPESGSYTLEDGRKEWVIEGRGVMPDVWVENDPYEMYHGNDSQLLTAVEIAMERGRYRN